MFATQTTSTQSNTNDNGGNNVKNTNETVFVFSDEFTGYTVIPNYILNERNLSYKAQGIYCQILQFQNSPTHKVYAKSLEGYKKDGRESVAAGIKELEEAGYLKKETLRDDKGKITGIKYTIFAKPCVSKDSSVNGFSVNGFSVNGKSATKKENGVKKKIFKKENNSSSSVKDEDEEIIKTYKDYRGIKRLSKAERQLVMELIEKHGKEKVSEAIAVGVRKSKDQTFSYIESVCNNGVYKESKKQQDQPGKKSSFSNNMGSNQRDNDFEALEKAADEQLEKEVEEYRKQKQLEALEDIE